jgi:4-amino-4-deoxy-L-arabinose transferase-like glycosyltransferase
MELVNIVAVPAITAVIYTLIEVLKKALNNNEKFLRLIPLISLIIGSVAGIICFYFIPSIIPATNVVVAIIIGAASGLTATGTNQIFKQFNKDKQN